MITYENINEVTKDLCLVEPDTWLAVRGISREAMHEYLGHKVKAAGLMVAMGDGTDENAVDCLKASIAAAFETGFELAFRQGNSSTGTMEELVSMLERTTTLGNALGVCLNDVIDVLQEDGGYTALLDQVQARLSEAYRKAYPGEVVPGE